LSRIKAWEQSCLPIHTTVHRFFLFHGMVWYQLCNYKASREKQTVSMPLTPSHASPHLPSFQRSNCPANFHENPQVLQNLHLIVFQVAPSCSQDTAAPRAMGPSCLQRFHFLRYGGGVDFGKRICCASVSD